MISLCFGWCLSEKEMVACPQPPLAAEYSTDHLNSCQSNNKSQSSECANQLDP